jgi:hypothetical protein
MSHGVQYVCYIDDTGFYLGDAHRIAQFLGRDDEELSPVWVPAQADGNITLLRTPDVQALWKALGILGERYRQINPGVEMDQTVLLFMPCGRVMRYVAFDDLPWQSQGCPCGDPNHWAIRYTGAPGVSRPPSDQYP